jgi:hypothetical protein
MTKYANLAVSPRILDSEVKKMRINDNNNRTYRGYKIIEKNNKVNDLETFKGFRLEENIVIAFNDAVLRFVYQAKGE